MAGSITIELSGMRFFGAHGLYAEEAKLGNEFEMHIQLQYKSPKKLISSIDQTINYVEVYRMAEEELSERKNLLETCAMKIAERLHQEFEQIEWISISVKKLAPPITNFTGSVGVKYERFFK